MSKHQIMPLCILDVQELYMTNLFLQKKSINHSTLKTGHPYKTTKFLTRQVDFQ